MKLVALKFDKNTEKLFKQYSEQFKSDKVRLFELIDNDNTLSLVVCQFEDFRFLFCSDNNYKKQAQELLNEQRDSSKKESVEYYQSSSGVTLGEIWEKIVK